MGDSGFSHSQTPLRAGGGPFPCALTHGLQGKSHYQVQPWASKQTRLSCFKLFLRGRCWTNCLFSVSSLPLCSMTKIPEGSPAGVSARDGVGGAMLHHQRPSSSRPGDLLRRCLKHTELKENHSTPSTPPQMVRYRLAGNSLKMCPQILLSPVLPLSLSLMGPFSVPISPDVLLASEMGSVQRRLQEAITPPFPFFTLARKCLVGPIRSGLSTLGGGTCLPRKASTGLLGGLIDSATHDSAGAGEGPPAHSLASKSPLGPQPPAGEALPGRVSRARLPWAISTVSLSRVPFILEGLAAHYSPTMNAPPPAPGVKVAEYTADSCQNSGRGKHPGPQEAHNLICITFICICARP